MFAFYADDNNVDVNSLCDFACNTVGLCICEVAETYSCDYNSNFTSIDALEAAAAALPASQLFCAEMWTLEYLASNMTANLDAYAAASNDYGELFGYYEEYIKDMIQVCGYPVPYQTSQPGKCCNRFPMLTDVC